jgi:isocitrate dehydrogenase (NAD+)
VVCQAKKSRYFHACTDETSEFQDGFGTAGSANIGKRYAMFEAIHGSAHQMIKEGRKKYADLSSLIRAGAMMLRHIGFPDKADKLELALDVCGQYEKKHVATGRETGATAEMLGIFSEPWFLTFSLA